MGAHHSTLTVHAHIDAAIPHHAFELYRGVKGQRDGPPDLTLLFTPGVTDRGQFIQSLRILLGANGRLSLVDKRFRLVFTRAAESVSATGEEQEQVYASMVATDAQGVIAAKVTSTRAGVDNYQAFQMFRKTVEMRMHEMLETIPDVSKAAPATASSSNVEAIHQNNSTSSLASTILPDEPPAYEEVKR